MNVPKNALVVRRKGNSLRYCLLLVACLITATAHGQSLPRQVENAREQNGLPSDHEASDPLGRNTPNGTVLGFLESARNDRYQEAAQYLQMSENARTANGERIARELYVLMETAFVERIGIISGRVEGSHQVGVPRDRQRIGVFRINGADTNVDLAHLPDPTSGNVWLFSSELVTEVPDLFAQVESGEAQLGSSHLHAVRRLLNTIPRQVIALVVLIALSLALARIVVFLIYAILRIFPRWRHYPYGKEIFKSVTAALTLILAVIFHQIGVYILGIPMVTRLHYQRITSITLVIGVAWLLFRLINVWSNQARARTLDSSDYRRGSIILLGQRIFKVLAIIVAGLLILSILGFDITAALAGLGIGSIALAFAAQKTLENLLGGVSILGDEVIRIGEICKIGDRVGTVEDISLRSTRIRTLDGTVLSVPNGELASMNLENISRREKSRFRTRVGLRSETSPDQLRSLLSTITSFLEQYPKVGTEALRVHLVGFGESSLDLEVNCYILTSNLDEFLAIREDLLFRIMELVAQAGTGFAIPSRALYTSRGTGLEIVEESGKGRHATSLP